VNAVATKIAHIREATLTARWSAPASDALYLATKRALDVILAMLLLVVLAPLLGLIALAVALDSPGPVIFRQKRVLGDQPSGARHPEERVFEFWKFRSMTHRADESLHRRYIESLIKGQGQQCDCAGQKLYKLGHDPRITRVGRFLRKTSLDELPQLVNILRGEMSFVGPRPAIPYEVKQYQGWHRRRLVVTQGLTGLWQVSGRNELSFDDMVQLDLEYVQCRSLWLDVKIMLATLPAVLSARGVH
jgi:lipopolysaccharide/colanic/teichoic acid biosynthesis glycosyltransferase